MPGGPRGLQNRRRPAWRDEVGSIPILSAISFPIRDFRLLIGPRASRIIPIANRNSKSTTGRREVNRMSREQIRKLTSLSSCAG